MRMKPWLQLFRIPNLPTAPGDALAGAAMFLPFGVSAVPAFGAAGAALFLYMAGLADNDICDTESDRTAAPDRPLPSGALTLRAVKVARGVCWGLALLTGALFNLPPAWWVCAVGLAAAILAYNRLKESFRVFGLFAMGICRGLSVVAGAFSVYSLSEGTAFPMPLAFLATGWILYIVAVTRLAEGEERAEKGLSVVRYVGGLMPLLPVGALLFHPSGTAPILPLAGCLFTAFAWCLAVSPLGRPHTPSVRRAAVGRTVGALLYLQTGFMLIEPRPEFLAAALALWICARFIRRLIPSVSGS